MHNLKKCCRRKKNLFNTKYVIEICFRSSITVLRSILTMYFVSFEDTLFAPSTYTDWKVKLQMQKNIFW